ncbi:MAG: threonine 3-dehydrogenase [Pseudohongiellaceae bacterium]
MTTALVIGAGGQIGSDLVPALTRLGYEVHMFDLRPVDETAAAENMTEQLAHIDGWRERWTTGDAASDDISRCIETVKPDLVFHLAALLSATGEAKPGLCWDVNMGSLRRVVEGLSKQSGRPRLLWPSSIAAFGPLPEGPSYGGHDALPNEFPLLPTTMYGVTKVAGELFGAYAAQTQGVDFRSVRFPGLLSATEPGGGSSDYANEMYFAAARGESSVEVFVRDDTRIPFMHMTDAVAALLGLAAADEGQLTRRTYNVSSFAPTAGQIAQSIHAAGLPLDVAYVPDHRQAFVDSWPSDIDDTCARKDWGWAPQLDLAGTTERLLSEIKALFAI